MYNYDSRLIDSSRMIVDIMVAEIGNNREKFDEMFMLAMLDEYPVSMRAARIITLCSFKHINLIQPHIAMMLKVLPVAKVDGVRRSFLKIFAELPLPLDDESIGRLADTAFCLLKDYKQAIAIRAYSIDILANIVRQYPDMKPELTAVLESVIPDASVGLKSRCRKLLKKIRQE